MESLSAAPDTKRSTAALAPAQSHNSLSQELLLGQFESSVQVVEPEALEHVKTAYSKIFARGPFSDLLNREFQKVGSTGNSLAETKLLRGVLKQYFELNRGMSRSWFKKLCDSVSDIFSPPPPELRDLSEELTSEDAQFLKSLLPQSTAKVEVAESIQSDSPVKKLGRKLEQAVDCVEQFWREKLQTLHSILVEEQQ